MNDDKYLWDPKGPPSAEIAKLEQALLPYRHVAGAPPAMRRRTTRFSVRTLVMAAGIVAAVALGSWRVMQPSPWSVENLAGSPTLNNVRGERLAVGASVTTDTVSTARIAVGRIGEADVGPGSRVDVVNDGSAEHRLALRYGTLHATIWAPPRFFVVETPLLRVVDLGCIYSLRMDADGNGVVAVSYGEVQLEGDNGATLVTAGTAAHIRGRRAGLPFPLTATGAFQRAVTVVDSTEVLAEPDLAVLLHDANAQGTITLWHLVSRANSAQRARIVERIVTLTGVSTPEELRKFWNSEPSSLWQRFLVRFQLKKPTAFFSVHALVGRAGDQRGAP